MARFPCHAYPTARRQHVATCCRHLCLCPKEDRGGSNLSAEKKRHGAKIHAAWKRNKEESHFTPRPRGCASTDLVLMIQARGAELGFSRLKIRLVRFGPRVHTRAWLLHPKRDPTSGWGYVILQTGTRKLCCDSSAGRVLFPVVLRHLKERILKNRLQIRFHHRRVPERRPLLGLFLSRNPAIGHL